MCNCNRHRSRRLQLGNLRLSRSQLLLKLRLAPPFDGCDDPADLRLSIQREITLTLRKSLDRLLQQTSSRSQPFNRTPQLILHLNLHTLLAFFQFVG